MSDDASDMDVLHSETMSALLDAFNMRQHFPGVADTMKTLQGWMTEHSKLLASNDMLRLMRNASAAGNGVDWHRLATCLENVKALTQAHHAMYDQFLGLCIRSLFVKAPWHDFWQGGWLLIFRSVIFH